MATPLTIRFLEEMELDDVSIRGVQGLIGLYFIYLIDVQIPYPTCPSRLIYIGMSESSRNSISNRLRDHTPPVRTVWTVGKRLPRYP